MTPLGRAVTSAQGEKPDKLPIAVVNFNTFACQYYGLTVQEYLENPRLAAEISLRFIREFQIDSCMVTTAYILYGCGPELGPRWEFPGDNFPGSVEGVVKGREDLDLLAAPREPSGYFKKYLEIIEIVQDAAGNDVLLNANVLGPFSIACFMRGLERVMLDTRLDKEFFHEYMRRCVDLSKFFGRHVLATGLKAASLNEIFVTPDMVGPKFYHEQIAPYDREVQEILGVERVRNVFGALMGEPGDLDSQREAPFVFQAFFGIPETIETVTRIAQYRRRGLPQVLTISGRALSGWSVGQILDFVREGLDYLVRRERCYPSISFISVQAESTDKAAEIAEKIRAVVELRDNYVL